LRSLVPLLCDCIGKNLIFFRDFIYGGKTYTASIKILPQHPTLHYSSSLIFASRSSSAVSNLRLSHSYAMPPSVELRRRGLNYGGEDFLKSSFISCTHFIYHIDERESSPLSIVVQLSEKSYWRWLESILEYHDSELEITQHKIPYMLIFHFHKLYRVSAVIKAVVEKYRRRS